jgi:Ran GTPase-activating protein (RanGAP) involved in mRNA processing and transport
LFSRGRRNFENIARLEISKNQLRDLGGIELSKHLKSARNLVHLDVSSNEMTHRGICAISDSLLNSPCIISLNMSTCDGIRRNRLGQEGGSAVAKVLNGDSMLQMLILNNVYLGNKGLKFILDAIQE